MQPTVSIADGDLRGVEIGGVSYFRNIPYAKAPVGQLRFSPPQPPSPWAGERDATVFGPIAPQPPALAGLAIPGEPSLQDEDCLNLNVATPSQSGRLPVMVWIHGGGFLTGSGSSLAYDPTELVTTGDVVVVTINYRLGILGFLGHPAFADHEGAFGNFGLLDQLCALRWVRDNIAAFGGDPSNVTVFGESAGSMSIATMLAMQDSAGLITKVILQSGPAYVHHVHEAASTAELVCELASVPLSIDALRALPVSDLLRAQAALSNHPAIAGSIALPLLPVIDGVKLLGEPLARYQQGAVPAVPMVIGTTRDEMALFALSNPSLSDLDEAGLEAMVARAMPTMDPSKVCATYKEARASRGEAVDIRSLWIAIGTDRLFRWPSIEWATANSARGVSAYLYLFTFASPVFGGILGSCHALDIPFVFGSWRNDHVAMFTGNGDDIEPLSRAMIQAWTTFAHAGTPNIDQTEKWQSFEPITAPTMVLGPEQRMNFAPRSEELAVFRSH